MNKKGLKFITLVSASFLATSCSLFETKYFDWLIATNDNTVINYGLLIGQNEHSDSIERTRYTREALDTRDAPTEVNGNANLGVPKQGHIKLNWNDETNEPIDPSKPVKEVIVNEVEHMEQKSLAGVTWDTITANGTTATWICKHNKHLTMIVSNNDGMAEGALSAANWINNLPLFGYDANETTLRKIKDKRITGTVDQNAAIQTATAYLMIRNICEDRASGEHKFNTKEYNPLNRNFEGLEGEHGDLYVYGSKGLEGSAEPNGWLNVEDMSLDKADASHAVLAKSIAIDQNNIDLVLDDEGEVKGVDILAWQKDKVVKTPSYQPPSKTFKVCHVYNNSAEVYLQGTMQPYYEIYAPQIGLDINKIDGDGVDESVIFNKISSACESTTFDAFLINMVTTTDGAAFVNKIAEKVVKAEGKGSLPKDGWANWEDRLETPLIFWNKQPKTIQGTVDLDVMNNKFFKYTYYVGVDAAYGGKVQGKMIKSYLDESYLASLK